MICHVEIDFAPSHLHALPRNNSNGQFLTILLPYVLSFLPVGLSLRQSVCAHYPVFSGPCQQYIRVFAKQQLDILPIQTGFHLLGFRTCRGDFQIQAASVEKGIGAVFGVGVVDLFGYQWGNQYCHLGTSLPKNGYLKNWYL